MKPWAKVGIGCGAVVALASVGLVLVLPTLLPEIRRVAGPIQRMKRSQTALDDLAEKAAWKRLEKDALSEEQIDRFFAVPQRVDAARRKSERAGAQRSVPAALLRIEVRAGVLG